MLADRQCLWPRRSQPHRPRDSRPPHRQSAGSGRRCLQHSSTQASADLQPQGAPGRGCEPPRHALNATAVHRPHLLAHPLRTPPPRLPQRGAAAHVDCACSAAHTELEGGATRGRGAITPTQQRACGFRQLSVPQLMEDFPPIPAPPATAPKLEIAAFLEELHGPPGCVPLHRPTCHIPAPTPCERHTISTLGIILGLREGSRAGRARRRGATWRPSRRYGWRWTCAVPAPPPRPGPLPLM